jgi:hypothetical protein
MIISILIFFTIAFVSSVHKILSHIYSYLLITLETLLCYKRNI